MQAIQRSGEVQVKRAADQDVELLDPAAAVAVTRGAGGDAAAVAVAGWRGKPPSGEALLAEPLWQELLAAGIYHPDAGVRRAAVNALTVQGWIPRTDAERVTFDLARGDLLPPFRLLNSQPGHSTAVGSGRGDENL